MFWERFGSCYFSKLAEFAGMGVSEDRSVLACYIMRNALTNIRWVKHLSSQPNSNWLFASDISKMSAVDSMDKNWLFIPSAFVQWTIWYTESRYSNGFWNNKHDGREEDIASIELTQMIPHNHKQIQTRYNIQHKLTNQTLTHDPHEIGQRDVASDRLATPALES